MSSIKRLSPPQSRKVNSLVRRECCNCDNGHCMLDCISVLIFVYLLSVLINFYLGFDLAYNFYLVLIFATYILISARRVRKYENL